MNKPFGLFVEVAGETRCLAILSTRLPRAIKGANKIGAYKVNGAKTFIARADVFGDRKPENAQPAGDRIAR
jgi:hypothetical protein